jgi:predicted nuclease with TOPRIM domain
LSLGWEHPRRSMVTLVERVRLGRELREAREKLKDLQGEKVVLIEKYGWVKDLVVRLTKDLKQYKENQELEMHGRE